jgi:hypothetical protein
MNIQNITALAEQLQSLGFENAGYWLLKRICFKPDSFLISQKIEKGKDKLTFQLFFERDNKQNVYSLMYYDAILQKEIPLTDVAVNGINAAALERSVAEIDWKNAFDFNSKKLWNAEDKISWEKEQKIETVIEDFAELEKSEEGKAIAVGLKLKYWNGVPYQELFGNISPLKNKLEVSQRFYFFDGQPGISIDEANRFLQNRWLEKQMQAKRKQPDAVETGEAENDNSASNGSGLLKKKRLSRSKVDKTHKSVQH